MVLILWEYQLLMPKEIFKPMTKKDLIKKIKSYLKREEKENGYDTAHNGWTTLGYANNLLSECLEELKWWPTNAIPGNKSTDLNTVDVWYQYETMGRLPNTSNSNPVEVASTAIVNTTSHPDPIDTG